MIEKYPKNVGRKKHFITEILSKLKISKFSGCKKTKNAKILEYLLKDFSYKILGRKYSQKSGAKKTKIITKSSIDFSNILVEKYSQHFQLPKKSSNKPGKRVRSRLISEKNIKNGRKYPNTQKMKFHMT